MVVNKIKSFLNIAVINLSLNVFDILGTTFELFQKQRGGFGHISDSSVFRFGNQNRNLIRKFELLNNFGRYISLFAFWNYSCDIFFKSDFRSKIPEYQKHQQRHSNREPFIFVDKPINFYKKGRH